jgi:hypothetical protein
MRSDLVYSILSQNGTPSKTRVGKVRYWTLVTRLFHPGDDLCRWVYGDLWRGWFSVIHLNIVIKCCSAILSEPAVAAFTERSFCSPASTGLQSV